MRIKKTELLLAAGVLAIGLGLGGSVVMLETQEASAQTLRTFALRLPGGSTLSDCVDYQNATNYKNTISTKQSSETTYARINTCTAAAIANDDCQNDCGSFTGIDGEHFLPHSAVDILTGQVFQGDFGWLSTPGHGDRTTADPTSIASCYVKKATGDYTDDTTLGWVVDDNNTGAGDFPTEQVQPLCIASANFN